MPAKSGFVMSDAKNSSCGNPGRSSHSGTHPAPGASRTIVSSSGFSIVARSDRVDAVEDAVEKDVLVVEETPAGAKAAAVPRLDKRTSFIMLLARVCIVVVVVVDKKGTATNYKRPLSCCSFSLEMTRERKLNRILPPVQ